MTPAEPVVARGGAERVVRRAAARTSGVRRATRCIKNAELHNLSEITTSFVGMSSEPPPSMMGDVASPEGQAGSGNAGEERIRLSDPQQVQEWALRLGVSAEHLRELVAQVGPRVSDLQQRLSQPPVVD
jgi:hypothetical protein